mmetsp:Transcript_17004/g.23787  ORF Transcript_17004/g.23787 Transcript_17004/m.23787 type:complete len:272 (+) Transcript_17004:75-890(+)
MSLTSQFRKNEQTDWQKKMGVYVSAVMQELIDSYEVMLSREAYVDTLKDQLVDLKKQVQCDVLEEINIRKEGISPSQNFLDKKAQREHAVERLKKTIERWETKLEDSMDRMRRMSLLWKNAGTHYALQMETYKSDEERRAEKRYMEERRIIDEQMRKIAYDERQMKLKAQKLKEKLMKKKQKDAKEKKKQEKMIAEAHHKFEEASFDKNHKLLKDFRKTDVVINPPRKRELMMGAIINNSSDNDNPNEKDQKKEKSQDSKLKNAAKGMGLS